MSSLSYNRSNEHYFIHKYQFVSLSVPLTRYTQFCYPRHKLCIKYRVMNVDNNCRIIPLRLWENQTPNIFLQTGYQDWYLRRFSQISEANVWVVPLPGTRPLLQFYSSLFTHRPLFGASDNTINPLRTKLYLSNLKTQFVLRRKHSLPRL